MSAALLMVEDDPKIREHAIDAFNRHGFDLIAVDSTAAARRWLDEHDAGVILLDLVLPDGSGLDLLQDLRVLPNHEATQVIVLSGLIDEADRVLALEMGADDYVTKPFSVRELIARTRSALRRSQVVPAEVANDSVVKVAGLEIDPLSYEVRCTADGTSIELRKKEFDLLYFLGSHPKQVFSKSQILYEVWNSDPNWLSESTVTEHVRRLRSKLPTAVIETVWGVGYRLNPVPEG